MDLSADAVRRRLLVCVVLALVPLAVSGAVGEQIPAIGDLLSRTPGLDKILGTKDALTTNLAMASGAVETVGFFEPSALTPMTTAPRAADGTFTLRPGAVYELKAQSYCLLAGTRGPGRDDRYLDAPLAGPMADVVAHILEGASAHQDVAQQDIQMLLWSILAHAKVSDLPRELQVTASRLLSPSELVKVNGGALGLIPDAVKEAAFARLPAGVARVLSAEADLRELISRGAATYQEMEQIAVPSDVEDESGGAADDRSAGESWNFLDGLFVRYQPSGYSETTIHVYVPGGSPRTGVERDGQGRLARITDDLDRTIAITYDDSVAPRTFSGDPGVKAWAFRHVAYTHRVGGAERTDGGDVEGWTLVGMPNGRGVMAQARIRFVLRLASLTPAWFGGEGDPSADLADRYRRAAQHKEWYDKWREARDRSQGHGKEPSADDVIDENHYKEGLDKARKLDFEGEAQWLKDHNDSLGRMAAWTHCELSGGCTDPSGRSRPYNPARRVAVPGGSGGQRLGQSARSH